MLVNNSLIPCRDNRFVLFPIERHDLWSYCEKHRDSFWTAQEIDLYSDLADWQKLDNDTKFFIKNILAFFAASDGIVNENLAVNFYKEVPYPEARYFYSVQCMMESIHSEVYSLLIDTYISDEYEKNYLLNAIETLPPVTKKAEWAIKWINSRDFVRRLVAFACVEGIFFSGSFCAIFWLRSRGIMPNGLGVANEFINRDEGMHYEFACALYKNYIKFEHKLLEKEVLEIVADAVEIEHEFITQSLPVDLIGMNSKLMKEYICYIADNILEALGYTRRFGAEQPFPFMENIALESKSNFHEKRVTEYKKAGDRQIDYKNSDLDF